MPNEDPAADYPTLALKRSEERRIEGGHLWVFSNEIDNERTPLTGFTTGGLCRVVSSRDKFLGFAYVNPHSLICARILGRDPRHPPSRSLFVHRLQVALAMRQRLFAAPYYRLVYGESDGLPGLVLDRYGDTVVGQIATAGMEEMRGLIAEAVHKVLRPERLIWKNDSAARELEGLASYVEAESGPIPADVAVEEGGLQFLAPLEGGQKTGWFFDQSANRLALARYVREARVLDVFSYVGAWSVAALRAGAREAWCVDSSAAALAAAARNAAANGAAVHALRGDAFDALEELRAQGERFDVVILDPPAFIKKKKQLGKGEAAYRRLNQLGLQLLERDGILVSCSCSYHLPADDLIAIIQRAARHTGRFAQILETGGQSPDHPIHPAIPETRYLKAFFCRVVEE